MARYLPISAEGLAALKICYGIFEQLQEPMDAYIYGVTEDPQLLELARAAVQSESDTDQSVPIDRIAVCIPVSEDSIHFLLGSGLKITKAEFAYVGGDEGVRTSNFLWSSQGAKVSFSAFRVTAVAMSDAWIGDFMTENAGPLVPDKEIARTAPATAPKASMKKVVEEFLG